jgi:hypothetical protein
MTIFFCGMFGSIGVDVFGLYASYIKNDRLAAPYDRWVFWGIRLSLAMAAGGLAYIHDMSGKISPVVAMQLGAAAPAVFGAMMQESPKTPGSGTS